MELTLIDTNVTLGQWPFRHVPGDQTPELVARLRRQGVTQAWAGSFAGVFHRDVSAANAWLADECRRQADGWLLPFGEINPTLPDWEEDLRRCHETHRMPGIRLHPNYHGYRLDDPVVARVFAAAAGARLIVQLVVSMEDERTQPRFAQVPHADATPLSELLAKHTDLRVHLVNPFRNHSAEKLAPLLTAGRVYVDIANLENVGGVERLVAKLPLDRILFGSHFPLFYWEAARLKLRESRLTDEQLERIARRNAEQLLAGDAMRK